MSSARPLRKAAAKRAVVEDDDEEAGAAPRRRGRRAGPGWRQRPLWSGAIAFGMVTIAVGMFTAVRDHVVHFHQISRRDRKRIRYLKVAEGDTEEVPADEIVKGYQLPDGTYVTFDDDELERIAARKSRVISIDAFVGLAEIDPRHFDRAYYLLPADEAAAKPYRLLVEALQRSERVGIAQMVMHNKEYLVAVRGLGGILCLETMHFPDEIVDPDDLRQGHARPAVGEREAKMADQLIASLSGPFEPAAYHDTYQERLRAAIQRKAKGKTLTLEDDEEAEPGDGKVLDLMAALQHSVEQARRRGRSATRPASRRKRHAG